MLRTLRYCQPLRDETILNPSSSTYVMFGKKHKLCNLDCDLPSTSKARSNSSHINRLLLVISYRAKFSYQLLRSLDYFK